MTNLKDPETSIVIVDDSKEYTFILRKLLQDGLGYKNVITVDSATDAMNLMREKKGEPTLLFVDYHYPDGTTGADLIHRLRSEELFDSKVAFFITSQPSMETAHEANKEGVVSVVVKPFNREKLVEQISRADHMLKMHELGEE